jgi:hypothetical protein
VWTNFEWLYWTVQGQSLPPLVTASPAGTSRAAVGAPGPTTDVLFGGNRANNDFRSGFRFSGGVWLNPEQTCGIEADFFFLGQSRNAFAAGGDGTGTILARPFFNTQTGQPDAQLIVFPGLAGNVNVDSTSNVIGGGVNAIHNLCCSPCGRVDLLLGYRYFGLTDDLSINEDLVSTDAIGGRVPPGYRFQVQDRFRTQNNFHGGVIGLAAERRRSAVFFGARASVALGATQEITDISGSTVITPPGGLPQVYNGGLLALPSNIGHYERTAFAVLPQIGLKAGVQVTECVRVYAGYDFMYLSNVMRAGDQIDLAVNPNQLPGSGQPQTGPARPAYFAKNTDVWLQGVNIGVSMHW